MNAFDYGKSVEAQGHALLLPYIRSQAYEGRFVVANKGPLAPHIQQTMGDVLVNTDPDTVWGVELKTERKKRPNLFIETWSNKNLRNRESRRKHGYKLGWLITLQADVLFYLFLDTRKLYIANLFKLQQWLLTVDPSTHRPPMDQYPEKSPSIDQPNDTWGRCVPIAHIERAIGMRRVQLDQLPLFRDDVWQDVA